MDRTTPTTSGQRTPAAPFAYQQRLLERTGTTSRGGGASLSRTTSQSSNPLLATPTGTPPRRWVRTHRVGASLDLVRGKWEERAKEAVPEHRTPPTQATLDSLGTQFTDSDRADHYATADEEPARFGDVMSRTPVLRSKTPEYSDTPRLTRAQKHQSMPEHIVAAALSPNNTGMTVETPESPDSPYTTPNSRMRFPIAGQPVPSSSSKHVSHYSVPLRDDDSPTPNARLRRSNTLESVQANSTGSSTTSDATTSTSASSVSLRTLQSETSSVTPFKRRPTSLYSIHRHTLSSPDVNKYALSDHSRSSPSSAQISPVTPEPSSGLASPTISVSSATSSVMSPSVFKSSYMARKAGDKGVARRIGRHLPRIASGDAPDDWEEKKENEAPQPEPQDDRWTRASHRERRLSETWSPATTEKRRPRAPSAPAPHDPNDVVGIPGRIRLPRERPKLDSPVPSARPSRGLWADVNRHLIQAYEYLCHVGEAQQWIEGCLGEELGFGVVEMEQQMRNGVVLAKLVRTFEPSMVRRIYEVCMISRQLMTLSYSRQSQAPKLDFRHSDNINVFFNFVRGVGLPEVSASAHVSSALPDIVAELHLRADRPLREEELPEGHLLHPRTKVRAPNIALSPPFAERHPSHLMAKRGMAQRIGILVGHLEFSDDQLQQTDKGLKDSGIALPDFKGVGKELAKEINEEPPEEEPETEEERE